MASEIGRLQGQISMGRVTEASSALLFHLISCKSVLHDTLQALDLHQLTEFLPDIWLDAVYCDNQHEEWQVKIIGHLVGYYEETSLIGFISVLDKCHVVMAYIC